MMTGLVRDFGITIVLTDLEYLYQILLSSDIRLPR